MNIIKDLKGTFYDTTKALNISDNSTIHTLLRLIENYTDEKQVKDVLVELRELNDDYFRSDVQETINTLSKGLNICPICSNVLTPTIEYVSHNEIDGNFKEESLYYECEECGFNDKDN